MNLHELADQLQDKSEGICLAHHKTPAVCSRRKNMIACLGSREGAAAACCMLISRVGGDACFGAAALSSASPTKESIRTPVF